jgi:hypothetical protein
MAGIIRLLKEYEKQRSELDNIEDKIIKELSDSFEKMLPIGFDPEREGIHFDKLKEKVEKKYRGTIPDYYIKKALESIENVLWREDGHYIKGRRIVIENIKDFQNL